MAFSRLEKAMGLVIGLDLAKPGTSRHAAKAALSLIGRGTVALAPRVASTGAGLIQSNPITAGAGLGLAALQTAPGQELLDMAAQRGRDDRVKFEQLLTDITMREVPKAKRRTKSKFNKMVSAGMKQAKASTSYGKKGTISNAKRAFSAVTKAASDVTKGKKMPKSGIKRKLMMVMWKI